MIDILLFCTGLIAGIVNAVAGGGAIFVFPALLLSGLAPITAATTSIAVISPGIISATYGFRKELRKLQKKYYLFIVPALLGSLAGALLLVNTSGHTFKYIVPWLVLASVILFAFQPRVHRHNRKPAHQRIKSPFGLLLMLVFVVAMYGSYSGAGFGFIILALLGFTQLKNVYQISGMKNVIAGCVVIVCTIIFAITHKIAWDHVYIPAAGTVIGGYLGAKLGHKLPPHLIRIIVIGAGLALFGLLFNEI